MTTPKRHRGDLPPETSPATMYRSGWKREQNEERERGESDPGASGGRSAAEPRGDPAGFDTDEEQHVEGGQASHCPYFGCEEVTGPQGRSASRDLSHDQPAIRDYHV